MIRILSDEGTIVMGDLMFENEESRKGVYHTLTDDEIAAIEDEYYANIKTLEGYVKKYNKKVEKLQIDRLCWIVVIR